MWRERTTSYLRHIHLVVHSAQQRLRFPVYVIQTEEISTSSSVSISEPLDTDEVDESVRQNSRRKKSSILYFSIPFVFTILSLITAIALLSSLLTNKTTIKQCPIDDCLWLNMTTTNEMTTFTNWNSSYTSQTTSIISTTLGKSFLYGENCSEHSECTLSKDLFCQYEYDLNQKHCFCETAYFWNKQTQQCEPKKDLNEACEYDNECRVDRGIVCDVRPDMDGRVCRCMGEYYWSKISNCGDLKIQDFVNCIDETYISSCLIKEIDSGIYHNVNIRQIENNDIEFDYFLLDSPEIQEIERSECCWFVNKRYCFGVDNEINRLLIFIIDINGIESYHRINQSVIGLPNVLTQMNQTIVCYVESNNSNLISIEIDPKNQQFLSVHQRRGKTYGERSCFIAMNRTTYCFYRDNDRHLAAIAMNGSEINQDVHIDVHPDTNLKTGPSCGWIGTNVLLKFYCFAIFNDEKVHRIEQKENIWSDWTVMPSEKIFIQRPLFITSQPPDDTSTTQSCHVLAIDTSNEVYISSNRDCAHQDSFSPWLLLQTEVGLLSFNGSFRLRDGRIGIYGIGIDDLPYYTTMDPITHVFEPIKLAVSLM